MNQKFVTRKKASRRYLGSVIFYTQYISKLLEQLVSLHELSSGEKKTK